MSHPVCECLEKICICKEKLVLKINWYGEHLCVDIEQKTRFSANTVTLKFQEQIDSVFMLEHALYLYTKFKNVLTLFYICRYYYVLLQMQCFVYTLTEFMLQILFYNDWFAYLRPMTYEYFFTSSESHWPWFEPLHTLETSRYMSFCTDCMNEFHDFVIKTSCVHKMLGMQKVTYQKKTAARTQCTLHIINQ